MAEKNTLKNQGWYHKPAWRHVRKLALQRDCYLCQACLKKGRLKKATEVHHLVPLDERPELGLELSNLQSLCWDCHELTKHRQPGKRAVMPDGVRIIAIRDGSDGN